MNRLIVCSLSAKNVGRLLKFPQRLLDPFEVEIISWIVNYTSKYSEIPSLDRLNDAFEDFIPVELRGDEVLDDVADQTLEKKKLAYFIAEMGKVIDKTRVDHSISESDVYSVMRTVTTTEDDDVAYSSFDRTKYSSRSHTKAVKLFTGIINRAMGDLHAGDYCLIVARLGIGKSMMTQWQAREWMLDGLKTLFISQEMLASEIFSRIDGMVAAFNPLSLRTEITDDIKTRLQVAQLTAKGSGGEIYAPRSMKTPEQIAMASKFFGVDTIIVDGVYQLAPDLMHLPPARWERITEVSGQLKQMAQSTRLPLLATTQIKRTGSSEGFTPEDIAFADALGQDADQILAVEKDSVRPNHLKISLIKNRYGPEMSTLVELNFDEMRVREIR